MFRNIRKFEAQCKKHPIEEKCRLIGLWCKKIEGEWEKEIFSKDENYLNSSEGKQELGMFR